MERKKKQYNADTASIQSSRESTTEEQDVVDFGIDVPINAFRGSLREF